MADSNSCGLDTIEEARRRIALGKTERAEECDMWFPGLSRTDRHEIGEGPD